MSKPTEALRDEIEATLAMLNEAARMLALFAEIQEAEVYPLVEAAQLKGLGLALAHQGGRLSMALEMTGKPPRPRCGLCPAPLTRDGLCSRAACPNSD